jgi:hypothetical protein
MTIWIEQPRRHKEHKRMQHLLFFHLSLHVFGAMQYYSFDGWGWSLKTVWLHNNLDKHQDMVRVTMIDFLKITW